MSRSSVSLLLLGLGAACSPLPDEVRHPEPNALLVRVSSAEPLVEVSRGSLIYADGDSLVIADRHSHGIVAVRDQPDQVIEVYRGQKATPAGTAKAAGKSGLLGLATGLLSAAAGAAVAEALGVDVEVGEVIKAGAVIGAATGVGAGITKGANEGEPVWHRVTVLQLRQQLCQCAHP
jgi:hypothetical protein